MPYTKVQIISFALAKLGNKPVTSLDNQSELVSAAEQAFDFLFPLSLSEQQWRFACKIVQVSALVTEPVVSNWKYIYQLPSDYLKMIRQYPHNYSYEVYNLSQMYSNIAGPLYIEYMYQPTIASLPAYFCNYLCYRIAEHLALSNAHSVQFAQKLQGDMEIARTQALAADAQNRPNTPLVSKPMITNRALSSYGGFGYG